MTITEETITKLSDLWYRCMVDHHKDCDCHFYVNTVWSYGRSPVYRAEHWGYIYSNQSQEYQTYQEALEGLAGMIATMIQEEAGGLLSSNPPGVVTDWSLEYRDHFLQILADLKDILSDQ